MYRPHRDPSRAAWLGLAALVLSVAVSSTACQRDTSSSAEAAPAQRAAMRTVTVPVDGMICMVCAGRVKETLKAVQGVHNAQINLEKHNATIQYESGKVSVDQLTRTINELGYKAGTPTPAQSQ